MKAVVIVERSAALLLACFENLVHGGVIFGWPSLVFILIQLGYFSDLCNDTSENRTLSSLNISTTIDGDGSERTSYNQTCREQDSRLQLVYSLAVASQTISMFPLGFFFDRFGTRSSRHLVSLLLLIGYLMMGFSSPLTPLLLFPGTISFTVAGSLLLFSTMQIGNVFPGRKSTVISLMNGMYSSSTIVFLIAKAAYEAGMSLQIFFSILAGSVILLSINTFIIMPVKHIPWPYPDHHRLVTNCTTRTDQDQKGVAGLRNEAYVEDPADDMGCSEEPHGDGVGLDSVTDINGDEPTSLKEAQRKSDDGCFEDEKRRKYPTFRSCILSPPFWMILLWLAILQLHLYFIFGAVNFFLTRLTNNDERLVSRYTDAFAIIQTFVFFGGPLGGLFMDRNKLQIPCSTTKKPNVRGQFADMRDSCLPLAVTSLSAVGYSVCLLIPSLPLQYLTFVFILIMRSLLFGAGASVTTIIFPMQYFASVYGAIRTMSGFVSFLQYPIFILIQNYFNDDPFWVIVAFIVADCVTLILPIALYVMSRGKSNAAAGRTSADPGSQN